MHAITRMSKYWEKGRYYFSYFCSNSCTHYILCLKLICFVNQSKSVNVVHLSNCSGFCIDSEWFLREWMASSNPPTTVTGWKSLSAWGAYYPELANQVIHSQSGHSSPFTQSRKPLFRMVIPALIPYLEFLLFILSAISLTAWGWDITRLKPYWEQEKSDRPYSNQGWKLSSQQTYMSEHFVSFRLMLCINSSTQVSPVGGALWCRVTQDAWGSVVYWDGLSCWEVRVEWLSCHLIIHDGS